MDAISLHWRRAVADLCLPDCGGRAEAPIIYTWDDENQDAACNELKTRIEDLAAMQLLKEEPEPVGRISGCRHGGSTPQWTANNAAQYYSVHSIVSQFFRTNLLSEDQRVEMHKSAAAAVTDEIKDGPLDSFSGMFAKEGTGWQEMVSSLVYQMGHVARSAEARFMLFSLYLEAFWWWGYYVRYRFCDWLVYTWERLRVPRTEREEHVQFLRNLRTFNAEYPLAWWYEHEPDADWHTVEEALRELAASSEINLDEPIESTCDRDKLHTRALVHLFLAHCNIGLANWELAESHYRTALKGFEARKKFNSTSDEWNEAWTLCEMADFAVLRGNLRKAEELCRQSEERERQRVESAMSSREEEPGQDEEEEEFLMHETLANIARVRADIIANTKGTRTMEQVQREALLRSQAAFHAFAFQVAEPQATRCMHIDGRFEGGPDPYTEKLYTEMRRRIYRRVVDLQGRGAGLAAAMAEACIRHFELDESLDAGRVIDRMRNGGDCPAERDFVAALFPKSFEESGEEIDKYVADGLDCVERIGRRYRWL